MAAGGVQQAHPGPEDDPHMLGVGRARPVTFAFAAQARKGAQMCVDTELHLGPEPSRFRVVPVRPGRSRALSPTRHGEAGFESGVERAVGRGVQVAKFDESSIRRHERVRGGDFLAIRHTETGCYLSVKVGKTPSWPRSWANPRIF
jgi:hypothetical protein